ncbi:acyltransferase family protein [Sphingomonas bacterium]|uniref:acyltransferase family protein n=1 Tax=Sphingomonas bacterium TaxID=1895847 RepID=UPI00260BF8A1|nr:acyltransferase family protein [Sphingomonas bacterium]MDB5678126.1 acyltransferase [Sphingomonas bacterium]
MRNSTIAFEAASGGSESSKPGYRADIDGLRALAILPVVWFHSGLPGASGGFVGVDIFFVISGYLITRIISGDLATGSFSFGHFYRRRFRRIAPALVVVLIFTLAVGYLLMVPDELVKQCRSAIAALAMIPNIFFAYVGGGDYFAIAKRAPPPLLHTWSLGIEEQFYLIFPLFLMIAARFRVVRPAIVLVVVLSFALCVIGTTRAPIATFYLLPGRAWELGLGAMLAVETIAVPARLRAAASVIGIAMIAASIALLEGQGVSPLWAVAAPAVGAMLLIGSGPGAPVNRALGLSPFVWVGRISYSLYLWHWPIFAFLQRWWIDDKLPVAWSLAGIAVSIAMAWITYRWVEQPARRGTVRFGAVAAIVAGGAAVVTAIAVVGLIWAGVPERFTPRARVMLAQADDYAPLARKCFHTAFADIDGKCLVGRGLPTALIWGDSHAATDSAGIAAALGVPSAVVSSGGCPPVIDPSAGVSEGCAKRNRAILAWLQQRPHITTIVLTALWHSYEMSGRERLWRGVQSIVTALGGRRIIVLAGVPYPGVDVPTDSAIREQWGRPPLRFDCPPARVPLSGVMVVDLSTAFCAYPEPWRLFVDRNHASMTANRAVIAPVLAAALAGSRQ